MYIKQAIIYILYTRKFVINKINEICMHNTYFKFIYKFYMQLKNNKIFKKPFSNFLQCDSELQNSAEDMQ